MSINESNFLQINNNYKYKMVRKDGESKAVSLPKDFCANSSQSINNSEYLEPISSSNVNNISPSNASAIAQIKMNLPISYFRVGEFSIPGIEDKASVFKLENGQKVVIIPKKGPVTINTTFNVGKNNEKDGQKGISHLVEHSLFNGSKDLAPSEYNRKADELGAESNAGTGLWDTTYSMTLFPQSKEDLEQAIKLNALQTQYPSFFPEQLEKEKKIVANETKMLADDPIAFLSWTSVNSLYDSDIDINSFLNCTNEDISSLDRDDLIDYYNTWYSPDNCCTVISGDVNVDETMQLVSKYFNKKSNFSSVSTRSSAQLEQLEEPKRIDIVHPSSTSADGMLSFLIPISNSPADLDKIDLIVDLLNSPESDFQKETSKYGNVFLEHYIAQKEPSTVSSISVNFEKVKEKDVEKMLEVLYSELTKFTNSPVSESELNNVINQKIEKNNTFAEYDSVLTDKVADMVFSNRFDFFDSSVQNYQDQTPASLMDFSKKVFDLNKVQITVCHEKDFISEPISSNLSSEKMDSASSVSFGAKKLQKETTDLDLQNMKRFHLWNNIETTFVPSNYAQDVNMNFSLRTPFISNANPASLLMLEAILNKTLVQKGNGSDIDISLSEKGLNFVSSSSTEEISTTVEMIKNILYNSEFTEEDFDVIKTELKNYLKNSEEDVISSLKKTMFEGVPIYASNEEILTQLDNLSLHDIQMLYSNVLSSSCANLCVSGNIEKSVDIINYEFSQKFPMFTPYSYEQLDNYNYYQPNISEETITVPSESEMVKIAQGFKYEKSGNIDDTAKILLLKTILGGGPSSRLFSDLRDSQGLVYSVSSGKFADDDVFDIGSIILYCETDASNNNENIDKVLSGFEKHTNALKTEKVTTEELEKAKKSLKSSLLIRLNSKENKSKYYSIARTLPYDVSSFSLLFDAIDKITPEDILSAANYAFENPPVTCISAKQETLDKLEKPNS